MQNRHFLEKLSKNLKKKVLKLSKNFFNINSQHEFMIENRESLLEF